MRRILTLFLSNCTFLYAKEKYEKKRATLQVDGLSALSYKTAPHGANNAARTANLITSDFSV